MALNTQKQTIETETLVASAQGQTLLRAEALVPGAGREAIEPLMADATLTLGSCEVQTGRVVMDGTAHCQAIYRQGEEAALRALAAQATLSHAIEIESAEPGMLCRVHGVVEHAEAEYENGHMIFLVTVALYIQVIQLSSAEVIVSVQNDGCLETYYEEICSVKLAAEATADALLKDRLTLPKALDARMALMEWGNILIEDVSPDLGGVRVKGKLNVEALISSGVHGRPVALLKYPMNFDQLVDIPDWLTGDVHPEIYIRTLNTRVEQAENSDDAVLALEAELSIRLRAFTRDCVNALADAYSTAGTAVKAVQGCINVCQNILYANTGANISGTVLLDENAPGAGTVLAVRALPNLSSRSDDAERSSIEGIVELTVLYMPAGSDQLASVQAALPFSIACPCTLMSDSWINIEVVSAEANALMSDRLEAKVTLAAKTETRVNKQFCPTVALEEGEPITQKSGIVLFWPDGTDTAWSIGKRYGIAVQRIEALNNGKDIEPGKAVILKI